jgi:hypothetical protein
MLLNRLTLTWDEGRIRVVPEKSDIQLVGRYRDGKSDAQFWTVAPRGWGWLITFGKREIELDPFDFNSGFGSSTVPRDKIADALEFTTNYKLTAADKQMNLYIRGLLRGIDGLF